MVKIYNHYENVYWWNEDVDAQDYDTIETECVSLDDYTELRALCDELAKELQSTMNILTIATREERDQIKRSFAVLEQWRKDNE